MTLTDARVTEGILNNPDPGLQEARQILERIARRDLYK